MNQVPLMSIPEPLPRTLLRLAENCRIYDSSCSRTARVYYLDTDGGLFLKTAPKHTLRQEAELTAYFHRKALAPEVVLYESASRDYLLTRQIHGLDCIHEAHLSQPEKLCDILGQSLRMLHITSADDCPVIRTPQLLSRAEAQYQAGHFQDWPRIPRCSFASAEEAWNTLKEFGHSLHADTLIHGDFCLPNVMLDNWKLAGFLDVGGGGLGDRHTDLFWGIWSLQFNLKTGRYTDRFLDAYGREDFCPDLLRAVAAMEALG